MINKAEEAGLKKRESSFDELLLNRARAVELKALDWVAERRHYFNPLYHSNVQRLKLAIKAAAELAMVCGLAITGQRSNRPQAYVEMASYLWHEVFQNEALQEYLLNNPTGLPSLSLYVSLCQCGYEDTAFRLRLESLLEDGYIKAVENIPSARLDFVYSLMLMNMPLGDLSADDLYRRSLLAKRPSLYPLTNDDVYTITHTIFFITDFGRAESACFSADERAYFRTALPRLLEFYLRRGDWDLTAELLINLRALRIDDVPAYHAGWSLLLAAQNEDGSYTGPDTEEVAGLGEQTKVAAQERDQSDADDGWILFRNNYHTTLAVALSIETALSP